MTPEAQRIAIAEAVRWTNIRPSNVWWYGLRPGNNGMGDVPGEAIPEYLNDLDAMHEAEATLDEIQAVEYVKHINRLGYLNAFHAIHTPAISRAEAFLKAIGKWDDAK